LAGATIQLYAADGTTLVNQTTTNARGYYLFDGLTFDTINPNNNTYFLVEGTAPTSYTAGTVDIFSQLNTASAATLGARSAIKVTIADPNNLNVTFDNKGLGNADSPTFQGEALNPAFTGQSEIHLTDTNNFRFPAVGSFVGYCVDINSFVEYGV